MKSGLILWVRADNIEDSCIIISSSSEPTFTWTDTPSAPSRMASSTLVTITFLFGRGERLVLADR